MSEWTTIPTKEEKNKAKSDLNLSDDAKDSLAKSGEAAALKVAQGHLTKTAKLLLGVKGDWEERPPKGEASDQKTVCFFLASTSANPNLFTSEYSLSGGRDLEDNKRNALRDELGIPRDKAQVCAEENLFGFHSTFSKHKAVFSIAFDRYGPKRACRAGCEIILRNYHIHDLA